jgi:hypothetical protein
VFAGGFLLHFLPLVYASFAASRKPYAAMPPAYARLDCFGTVCVFTRPGGYAIL